MKGIVLNNNELIEYSNRYNSTQLNTTDFTNPTSKKRPLPTDLVENEDRKKASSPTTYPSITTENQSALKHPIILKRVQVKIFGLMDDIEDETTCPWLLPIDQYTDIPGVGSIVEVTFPHTNNWNVGYYVPMEETTNVNYTELLDIITTNYTLLDYKEGERKEYDSIINKLDEIKLAITEANTMYDTWLSKSTEKNYGIDKIKTDYENWIGKKDNVKDLVIEFNNLIITGKREDDRFSPIFNAFETLPEVSSYPTNKVFNLSKSVVVECDDTLGSEKYTLFFKLTGDYIRLDKNGTVIKSTKDVRSIAKENNYVSGKAVQLSTLNGNDILLTEQGIMILDKYQNIILLNEEGVTIQSFSKENGKVSTAPNTILLDKDGINIVDTNDNIIEMSTKHVLINGILEIPN